MNGSYGIKRMGERERKKKKRWDFGSWRRRSKR